MSELLKLRHHHIRNLGKKSVQESIVDLSPLYQIGTLQEWERLTEVLGKAKKAINEGLYEDNGEKTPDVICDCCTSWVCEDSGVSRSNDRVRERESIFKTLKKDPVFQELWLNWVNAMPHSTLKENFDRMHSFIDQYVEKFFPKS